MDVTVPSTMVEDLLESDGGLRHDRLVAAVAQGDVGLETVTDEVLLLCGRDAMAGRQDHWTPWLLRQPDDHVEVARITTLRYLLSRGLVTMDDDRLRIDQPLASLSWALDAAVGLLTWQVQSDGGQETGGVMVLPDDLLLCDQVDTDAGLHGLTFRHASVGRAWVAAMLDPDGCCRRTGDPQTTSDLQALEPMLADLPGRPRSRASVVAASSVDGHQGLQSVSAIGTSRGLWLVQARGEPEPFASVQEVGEEDLLAIAGHLLKPAHT
jgi:hypothetical protein